MHQQTFCQKLFDRALGPSIHKARKKCLSRFIGDLLDYDVCLSVTEIGKKLSSSITVKSKIQAANYLIGNQKLASQIPLIYKGLAHFFFDDVNELVILIDWSGSCGEKLHTLTASIVGHGRSIPVYHQVFSESQLGSQLAHEQFLQRLRAIIPSHIKVTIITDAGFRTPWFREVISYGWDVIGRIYGGFSFQKEGEKEWMSLNDVDFGGVGKAYSLGKGKIGKKTKRVCGYVYTYKERLSGKTHKKNPFPDHEKQYSHSYRNGWILFSTIEKSAHFIVKYYKKRMQIEQNFKDIKNQELGLGLRQNKSQTVDRITMLWLLACLIIIISWWFGLMIETTNQHWHYQANTVKNKRVRSFIHLARMVYRHEPHLLEWNTFIAIIPLLKQQYHSFIELGVVYD
jgi:hypothetical protein